MKNIILSILGLLWLVGCQLDRDSRIAKKFGESFHLGLRTEVLITGAPPADSLNVVVESMKDSRCPEGANCIWAANAQVALALSDGLDTQPLTLCIGSCSEGFTEQDTASVMVGLQEYEVIMKAVLPYPSLNRPIGEQEAVLEVSPE